MPSGIQNNVVQGAAMQHVQEAQAAPVAAANLGQNHSVGKTVARVLGAICSFIAKTVISIVKAVLNARTEEARPHLPSNQVIQIMNNDTAGNLDNAMHTMARMRDIRDTVFDERSASFGLDERDNIDNVEFKERLRCEIRNSPTLVKSENLPELANKLTISMLAERAMDKLMEQSVPAGIELPGAERQILRACLLNSPDMKLLMDPTRPRDLEALSNRFLAKASQQICRQAVTGEAMRILLDQGTQRLAQETGIPLEQARTLNSDYLKTKFVNLSTHHEKTVPDTLQAYLNAYKGDVDKFINNRINSFNTVGQLVDKRLVSEELGIKWQKRCIELDLNITPECFLLANKGAQAILEKIDVNDLLPEAGDARRTAVLEDIRKIQFDVRSQGFNDKERGMPEQNNRTAMMMECMIDGCPPHVWSGIARNEAENVRFSDLLQEPYAQLMDAENEAWGNLKAIESDPNATAEAKETATAAAKAAREQMQKMLGTCGLFGRIVNAASEIG